MTCHIMAGRVLPKTSSVSIRLYNLSQNYWLVSINDSEVMIADTENLVGRGSET
jgi:hypothetical protein